MRINKDKFLRVPALESVMPRLGKTLVVVFSVVFFVICVCFFNLKVRRIVSGFSGEFSGGSGGSLEPPSAPPPPPLFLNIL